MILRQKFKFKIKPHFISCNKTRLQRARLLKIERLYEKDKHLRKKGKEKKKKKKKKKSSKK